jgi:hypothetical protein
MEEVRKSQIKHALPEGFVALPEGSVALPEASVALPEGFVALPEGSHLALLQGLDLLSQLDPSGVALC